MEDLSSSFWRDRPTFLTGATGFAGGWVLRALKKAEANVVCLVRDITPESEAIYASRDGRVSVVYGSVTDQGLLERVLGEYQVETVLHLAAQAIVGVANRNPVSTFEANIAGTWCVLEACRRSPMVKQVVVASSDKAYGDQAHLPYTEESALHGLHPYDVSKSCADLIAQTYAKSYGMPVGITRCGNFFGGGDHNWNRIVPGTIRSVIRGERPVIRSDGKYVRDYFYIEDGAEAYMTLAEALATRSELHGRAFNFSSEQPITVFELVDRILSLMDSSVTPDVRNEASNEIRHQYLSAGAARDQLGWTARYTLDEGLQRTISWYRQFFEQSP